MYNVNSTKLAKSDQLFAIYVASEKFGLYLFAFFKFFAVQQTD